MLLLFLLIPFFGMIITKFSAKPERSALATMFLMAAAGVYGILNFSFVSEFQFERYFVWMETDWFDVVFHIGVDGISFPLVLLTVLLGVVSVMVSKREIHTEESTYYMLLLGLVASIIGVFISLNLVFFFIFWEAILVLMFLLILRWGGENKSYAAMKFLLYTGIGSAALLLVIMLLGIFAGSLDMTQLATGQMSHNMKITTFVLLLFAFFIKIPIVPFHTWLPDAHTQAPTAGSMLLAGVLLKMGAYGLLRLGLPLYADVSETFQVFLFTMGTITIIYGALVSLAQTNLKRLIAYSSVNHMGFVLLGVSTGSTLGIIGAVFEMVSHGLISALLFALAGLIHQQSGTFDLGQIRGLATKMPRTAWLLVLACLGGMGLPSMTGFVAEFLILFATFKSFGYLAIIPLVGVILTGAYMVRLMTKAAFGKPSKLALSEENISLAPFTILLFTIFVLGLAPFLLISLITVGVFP